MNDTEPRPRKVTATITITIGPKDSQIETDRIATIRRNDIRMWIENRTDDIKSNIGQSDEITIKTELGYSDE